MIRLTLRQFRTEALAGFGAMVVLAILLAITGPHLAHVEDAFKAACAAAGHCNSGPNPVVSTYPRMQLILQSLVTAAPALAGLFFGAPLVARELEAGTLRLVWTQSVTRRRWLGVKLGFVGLAAMALTGLLTWAVDWWAQPLASIGPSRLNPSEFGWHGVVPIGYAAFAFALGVVAGTLLRRTVPAMAVTLAAFVAARLAVQGWLRPHLSSPLHKSFSLLHVGFGAMSLNASTGSFSLSPPSLAVRNSWTLSTRTLDRSGNPLTGQEFIHACPAYGRIPSVGHVPSPGRLNAIHQACVAKLASVYRDVVTYQPASRFWRFQWLEFGVFFAAAVTLCCFAWWWLARRNRV